MKKYYIYRNLHTKTFSVKRDNRVRFHIDSALVEGINFKVSEKGRQRVLRTRRKNVHATVACNFIYFTYSLDGFDILGEVYYNPYTTSKFLYNNTEISEADWVLLKDNKIFLLQEK
jgi:hypothetical protein